MSTDAVEPITAVPFEGKPDLVLVSPGKEEM